MQRVVASSWASFRTAPSSRKFTWVRAETASQAGRGKLPMVVVAMAGSCILIPPWARLRFKLYRRKGKDKDAVDSAGVSDYRLIINSIEGAQRGLRRSQRKTDE